MTITDEAVEAAAEALDATDTRIHKEDIRAALEAAAPHMQAACGLCQTVEPVHPINQPLTPRNPWKSWGTDSAV